MATRKLLPATILIVVVMASATVVVAQTAETGALGGTVTDATGAVLSGATVRVINAATGQVRTATSQSDGQYILGWEMGIENSTNLRNQ